MLYRDKPSLRIPARFDLLAPFRRFWPRRRQADLDLLALTPHLRRDLGLTHVPEQGEKDVRFWL